MFNEAALLAQQFHEAYERLAPEFSYETREASAVPWADVPENNKRLMVAVAAEIIAARPEPPVEGACQTCFEPKDDDCGRCLRPGKAHVQHNEYRDDNPRECSAWHPFKPASPPVEGALEEALSAALYAAPTHGPMCDRDGDGDDCRCWMGQGRAALAAARSGHDGLRGDRRLVELYGEWSEEYYAAGFYSPTPSSIEGFVRWLTLRRAATPAVLQDYELAMLDMLPAEARALFPDPVHKPDRSPR